MAKGTNYEVAQLNGLVRNYKKEVVDLKNLVIKYKLIISRLIISIIAILFTSIIIIVALLAN